MNLYSFFRLLVASTLLSLTYVICNHLHVEIKMRDGRYDLHDQDKGTSEGVLKVTSARSRLQCMTLCMTTDQCVTAGYVDNQCTLSTRRIDGKRSYFKFDSPGERLYTVRCVPRWSGMCILLYVTGIDEAGLYELSDDLVADNRPVYHSDIHDVYLYYYRYAWFIGPEIASSSYYHSCHADKCAPDMPQCDLIGIECIGWGL